MMEKDTTSRFVQQYLVIKNQMLELSKYYFYTPNVKTLRKRKASSSPSPAPTPPPSPTLPCNKYVKKVKHV